MSTWTVCMRLIKEHLKDGTNAAAVIEGDAGLAGLTKFPALQVADVDGGEPQFSVRGGVDYAKLLHIKVIAQTAEKCEETMRRVRRCWEKDPAASQARMQELTTNGVFNIYPEGSGEKSLPTADTTPQTFEGLVTMRAFYRETA